MIEKWDSFPINTAEDSGTIERKAFLFKFNKYEVWQNGKCIHHDEQSGKIEATLNGKVLKVSIIHPELNSNIKPIFSFIEISSSYDRIMWSKDIYDLHNSVKKFEPDISSLFYNNGVLLKITYTIHDPNILVEFYS